MRMGDNLVIFNVIGTPVFYIGQLVDYKSDVLKLQNTLMGATNRETGQTELGPVPHASRESVITINPTVLPGIMVSKPSDDLVDAYNHNFVKAYSRLTLV